MRLHHNSNDGFANGFYYSEATRDCFLRKYYICNTFIKAFLGGTTPNKIEVKISNKRPHQKGWVCFPTTADLNVNKFNIYVDHNQRAHLKRIGCNDKFWIKITPLN